MVLHCNLKYRQDPILQRSSPDFIYRLQILTFLKISNFKSITYLLPELLVYYKVNPTIIYPKIVKGVKDYLRGLF